MICDLLLVASLCVVVDDAFDCTDAAIAGIAAIDDDFNDAGVANNAEDDDDCDNVDGATVVVDDDNDADDDCEINDVVVSVVDIDEDGVKILDDDSSDDNTGAFCASVLPT